MLFCSAFRFPGWSTRTHSTWGPWRRLWLKGRLRKCITPWSEWCFFSQIACIIFVNTKAKKMLIHCLVWQTNLGGREHPVPLRSDGDGAGDLHRSYSQRGGSAQRFHSPTAYPQLPPLLPLHTGRVSAEPASQGGLQSEIHTVSSLEHVSAISTTPSPGMLSGIARWGIMSRLPEVMLLPESFKKFGIYFCSTSCNSNEFPIRESNPGLLHDRWRYCPSY